MPEPELDPRSTIDRDAEREQFADLVSFATPARMLVISDKLDRGKSTLLSRLKLDCKEKHQQAIPVCLVDLSDWPEPLPFAFVKKIVTGLKIDDKFPKFTSLNNARVAKNFDPFDTSGAERLGQVTAKSQISTGGGANVAGNVITGGGKFISRDSYEGAIVVQNIARGEFTDEKEEIARKKCIEVFFDDLRVLCATQSVVILLDHWEKCNLSLREWIREEFLQQHCFHPDKNLRPAKLAIVVAGNSHDAAKEKFGLRDNEFVNLFDNMQEYYDTVLSRNSLSSDWTTVHMQTFLKQHGFNDVSDDDIDYLRVCLKKGRTFRQILEGYRGLSSGDI